MQAAAGSTGAEAVGGQAQPGLFYQRLFPAKKRASDTSTSRGTSCRYPVRGRGAGAPCRGTARLLGLGRSGEGAHAGHRAVGHGGRVTSCSRNRSSTTTLPLQHPPSPPQPQPQQTTASRSSSRAGGCRHPAQPALGSPCSSTAADSYFQIHSSSLFWKSQKITELTAFPTCASTSQSDSPCPASCPTARGSFVPALQAVAKLMALGPLPVPLAIVEGNSKAATDPTAEEQP